METQSRKAHPALRAASCGDGPQVSRAEQWIVIDDALSCVPDDQFASATDIALKRDVM